MRRVPIRKSVNELTGQRAQPCLGIRASSQPCDDNSTTDTKSGWPPCSSQGNTVQTEHIVLFVVPSQDVASLCRGRDKDPGSTRNDNGLLPTALSSLKEHAQTNCVPLRRLLRPTVAPPHLSSINSSLTRSIETLSSFPESLIQQQSRVSQEQNHSSNHNNQQPR